MSEIEGKSEIIWDKWRNGEKTYQETIKELYKLFPEPKGFFECLERELVVMTNSNIFSKPQNIQAYFLKRQNVRNDLIQDSNWVQFWQTCEFLKDPKTEDYEALKTLDSHILANYHILICLALKQFIESDLEDSTEAFTLYQYYRLLKEKINSSRNA